jgi:hypothetical protein
MFLTILIYKLGGWFDIICFLILLILLIYIYFWRPQSFISVNEFIANIGDNMEADSIIQKDRILSTKDDNILVTFDVAKTDEGVVSINKITRGGSIDLSSVIFKEDRLTDLTQFEIVVNNDKSISMNVNGKIYTTDRLQYIDGNLIPSIIDITCNEGEEYECNSDNLNLYYQYYFNYFSNTNSDVILDNYSFKCVGGELMLQSNNPINNTRAAKKSNGFKDPIWLWRELHKQR